MMNSHFSEMMPRSNIPDKTYVLPRITKSLWLLEKFQLSFHDDLLILKMLFLKITIEKILN